MRGYSKILAVVCVAIMCATVFGNIAAGAGQNQGKHVDVFTDQSGNLHKVWRDNIDGVFQVFYANNIKDNNTGLGHGEFQITNSIHDVNYPQFSIDNVSGYAYIIWLIHDAEEQIWYCGSPDMITWSDAWFGGVKSSTKGNPNLDMNADDYLLYVTWKHDGSLVIEPDCDGDFIIDKYDASPFKYDHHSGVFNADAVTVDHALGINVAVDWEDDSDIKPVITPAIVEEPLVGSIAPYADVTLPEGDYTVVIKIRYSSATLPHYINEKYLRIYAYGDSWRMIGKSDGEVGGVDIEKGYVWAQTSSLSVLTITDASATDLDNDGIADVWDMDTLFGADEGAGAGRLTIFSGDSYAPEIYISPDNVYHITWVDDRDGQPTVYYKRSNDYGQTWTTDKAISDSSLSIQHASFAGYGNHLAVAYSEYYYYKTGPDIYTGFRVKLLRSIDGGHTWEKAFIHGGVNPDVAVFGDDVFVVYEYEKPSGGDQPHVYLEGLWLTWTDEGEMTSEIIFFTESGAQHMVPKISIDNNRLHILWAGYFDNCENDLYYIHKGLNDAEWIYEEVTQYYGENDPQAIAFMAKNGNLYLVWSDNRKGEYDLYAKWKDSDSGLWSDDIVLTDSATASLSPDFVVDSDGTVNLVWQEVNADLNSDIYYMKFSTNLISTDHRVVGEMSISGVTTHDYTKINSPDNDYQMITEDFVMDYFNVKSENIHIGTLRSGSMGDLRDSDNIYEVFNPAINKDGMYELSVDWHVPVDVVSSDYMLVIEVKKSFFSPPYNIQYSHDNGLTFLSLGTYDNCVDVTFSFPLRASLMKKYIINIHSLGGSGGFLYVDRLQIGIPTTVMELEHRWVMEISTPQATAQTFFLKGYRTPNNEGDSIMFSYSLDNINFINMFVLDKVADDGDYLRYSLPSSLAATVYIRATDIVRTPNEDQDSIFVDHMYIESKYGEIGTIIAPTRISSDQAIYSGYPAIGMNSLGKVYSVWHDFTYGNFEIAAITDATSSTIQTSQAVQILATSDDTIFTEETEFTMDSSSNVPAMHRSTLLSKLNLLSYMLSAEDYVAAYNKIEFDIKPYMESTITDEATMGQLLDSVNGIGETIEPLAGGGGGSPPPTPTSMYVTEQGKSGVLNIVWGVSDGATGYRLYRSTYALTTDANWKAYEGTTTVVVTKTNPDYTDSGLTDLTTYYYGVRAYNNYGWSDYGCSPDNSGTPYGPPYVVSKSPTGTGVSTGANIIVTFNEPMNQNSVEAAFKVIRKIDGVDITTQLGGSFSWSGNTMTWAHTTPFDWITEHTIKIVDSAYAALWWDPSIDKFLDSSGDNVGGQGTPTNPDADDYSWTFTTVANPALPPTVVSTTPVGDIVPATSPITVTFSEGMDHATTQNAFSMYGYYSETRASNQFTYSWSTDNKILTATPTTSLTLGQSYTIKILGTAKAASGSLTLDGNNNGVSQGSPTDDWHGGTFKTPVSVPTPVLTATSEEFILSWPAISNPRASNPYEIYISDSSSTWPTNPIALTSDTTYVMDVTTYGGLYGLEPHRNYYFRVKAHNTAGCYGTSTHVGAECGRVDYFLDVGIASTYGVNDMPSQLNLDMPHYGLTLPPSDTMLADGWSVPVFGSEPNPANWRQGTQQDYQRFFFNLGNGAENHIDYIFTFRYKSTGTVTLQQQVGPNNWISLENIYGDYTWRTASIWIDHNDYYDHSIHGGWFGTNVQFRFSGINSIYLDWIKAEPHAYYSDVMSDYFTDIEKHSPGVCLHEGDWNQADNSCSGEAGSRFYVNLPYRDEMYSLIITYKSGTNTLMQWNVGLSFINIGTLPSVSDWSTEIIKINRKFLHDYKPDNSFINVLFKFYEPIDIQSITLRTYRDWSVVPEWAPMDQLIMTLPPLTYKDDLWPMYLNIIEIGSNHIKTIELNVHSHTRNDFISYYQGIKGTLPNNVILRDSDLNNFWPRDYGPGFIINSYGQIGVIDWGYSSTRQQGGAYEGGQYLLPDSYYSLGVEGYPYTYFTHHFPHEISEYIDCGGYNFQGGNWQMDGNGYGYTTNSVPTSVQIELKLRYGVQDVRAIPPLPQYDETGHLDMFVYIASPDTVIVASFPEDPPLIRDNGEFFDTNYKVAEYAAAKFSEWGFTNVLRVYTPSLGGQITSTRTFAYSYTNALVMNGLVLIPYYSEFGTWNDNTKAIFETAFPGRIVEQVNSSEIIKLGGGTIHCITLTRPEAP